MIGDGAIHRVKPHQNEVKITVDAAIFKDKGVSGMGLVVRDHKGHLIIAMIKIFAEVMNPMLAEAIAVKEALSWAKETGGATIVESDCLVVIQMIRSVAPMPLKLGQVIEECREIIRKTDNIQLYFIK